MKFRSTAFLAVLFALLCAGYWGKQNFAKQEVVRIQEAKRIFDFAGGDVSYLEIEQIAEEPTAAQRIEGDTWKFVKPNETITPLHMLWSRVAEKLSETMNERTIEGARGNLAQYGLEEPALKVNAKTSGGKEINLRFGFMEPSQTFRYAQLDDGEVFLAKKDAFFELDRPRDALRHSFLVTDRESPILRFEYAIIWRGDSKVSVTAEPMIGEELVPVVLERGSAEEPWVMSSPYQAAANQERVAELVNEVQFGTVEEFIDEPSALVDYGLQPPAFRVTVFDSTGSGAQTLFIGDTDELSENKGVFAKWENGDSVFHVSAHLLSLFPKTPSAFREKRLLARELKDLNRIDYKDATNAFGMVLDPDKGWRLDGDDAAEDTNQVAISNYISLLSNVQAHSFQEGTVQSVGLDAPTASLSLHFQNDAAPVTIAFKPFGQEENYYLANQDNGQVVLIFDKDAEAMMVSPDNFRSRKLFSFNEAQVIEAAFTFQGAEFLVERTHGKWVLKKPAGHTIANQNDIDTILKAVNPLVGDPEPGEITDPNLFGFEPPVFSITLTLSDPDATPGTPEYHSVLGPLKIGYPTSMDAPQRFVQVPDRPGLFRVNNETLEAIRTALQGIQPG